jgi:hypothetical protein
MSRMNWRDVETARRATRKTNAGPSDTWESGSRWLEVNDPGAAHRTQQATSARDEGLAAWRAKEQARWERRVARVVTALEANPGLTQSEIADVTGLTRNIVQGALRRLSQGS